MAKKRKTREIRLDSDGEVDDVFIGDCDIHFERMNVTDWWMGVYLKGKNENNAITFRIGLEKGKIIVIQEYGDEYVIPFQKRPRA